MPENGGEVVILGSGTSHGVPMVGCRCPICQSTDPKNNRTRSSILVRAPEGNIIVDTTPEMRIQLVREQVDLVHAAIFTHGHADHIFGLDDLRQFGFLLDRDIPLFCEPLVEEQLRLAFSYAFRPPADPKRRGAIPRFDMQPMTLEPFELLGVRVQPLRLFHGSLPIVGFRIGELAYCTDVSEIPDETWPLLEGVQVLVIDALRFRPHPTHFNIEQAIEASRRIGAKQTYLTHICHDIEHQTVERELPEGVNLAYDGLKFACELQ
ncbi:MAG: MBL fold metallo-hydrolase [Rubinisphaera brasiliensis]|uniref:Beta-lactamase domain protein n=1 Tax=Rubinisphaera brasiliensis (strain ATCC 49424 / DSM 5305 / JCM 21570 / IAM 15109 / NBRC 103401 / IFAM 1448) TaxID=756272 RepID=F0SRK0_RUBBR|nr:MBL fold metallo-hydrolase [Rubinisphaera brasiliensis]ADY59123.1 beta-lactamase domain protein [Rubinisphaera brasiliensis DSM 5305]MBB03125.1 MBL fold metallo-hydrolase [Planctomyces sp.]MBR9800222.1 MBL fold metallo-hydrolase [bacterium]